MSWKPRACLLAVPVLAAMLALVGCAPEPGDGPSASASASSSASEGSSPTPTGSLPPVGSTPVPSSTAEGVPVTVITAGIEADGLEVTAIVTGETDPAAVCTLSASQSGTTRSVEVTANPSGENSYCPVMIIPVIGLSAGEWEITVSYRGAAGEGRSAAQTVVVP